MQNTTKERIQMLLGAMGDDEFERFMSELLPKIYPGFELLEPSFNFMGKTTKGKCDAHVYHANDDSYTAIICTTRQSDIRAKVLDDIDKLSSAKFASKIRRVLLCVNTPIKDEVEDYRKACMDKGWALDPLSLARVTRHTLSEPELLLTYFGEAHGTNNNPRVAQRRFDCGLRMKEARTDVSLPVSRLIEEIDFPSEREWCAIEKGQVEVSERYIDAMSSFTGVMSSWLKHGISPKYSTESIFDHQLEKIESIAHESPLRAYVVIEPNAMDTFLIVQFSEFRWRVFSFGFSMNFWNWIGDEHHIPHIFDLLKQTNRLLKHPDSRLISKSVAEELRNEKIHPSVTFKKTGRNSYWFDDLFDLYHQHPIAKGKYEHHGEWFVKLQDSFRRHVEPTQSTVTKYDEDV